MFKSFTKIFSMFLMGILINFSITGCGSHGSDDSDNTPPPSGAPTLVEVVVSPSHTYVTVGGVEQYSATAVYSDGTSQDVTTNAIWESSDTSVATVSASGAANGLKVGSTNISAKYVSGTNASTGNATLDVKKEDVLLPPKPGPDPTLKSVTIEGNNVVSINITEHLEAIATLTDGTTYIVNDKANWTSSDTSIATVNAAGDVTGIAEGPVVITAAGKVDSSIVATHNMTVTAATLESIQIEDGYSPNNPTPITSITIGVGEKKYITAWGIYSDGSREYINTQALWYTGDKTIAAMNFTDSSKVEGISGGTTTATAQFGGKKTSIDVTVTGPAITGVEIHIENGEVISKTEPLIIAADDEEYITAWAVYDNGNLKYINTEVFWSSQDQDVAHMDPLQRHSYVTGVNNGETTVSAKFGDYTGVAAVIVE